MDERTKALYEWWYGLDGPNGPVVGDHAFKSILDHLPEFLDKLVEIGAAEVADDPEGISPWYRPVQPKPHKHQWRVAIPKGSFAHVDTPNNVYLRCDCGERRTVPNVWPGDE